MAKTQLAEKRTSHRSVSRPMTALVFQWDIQSIPEMPSVASPPRTSSQSLSHEVNVHSGALVNNTTYLPGSQGDQTRLFAKRTFLHLMHKLRQLGVSTAAVVNLQRGRTKGRQEHGSQSPTYNQSCKEAAEHFNKINLAQAVKNTREGTCLSVTLQLFRPRASSLFSPMHLPLFQCNFPRSL